MSKNRKNETEKDMWHRHKDDINFADLIEAQEELDALRAEHGIEVEKNFIEKTAEKYVAWKEKTSVEYPVKKKTYCWLAILLGFIGVHHFYAKHWVKGLLHLIFCWTGVTFAMAVVDWMIAVPKKADANGMITM